MNKVLFYKKIVIGTTKDKEKLHEHLITQNEIFHCHDLGDIYRISKDLSKKRINVKEISSETTKQISTKKLDEIISQLMDEF